MTHFKSASPKHLPFALLLAISCLGNPLPAAVANTANGITSAQGENWTINMKDADIRDFIEQISSISGQTFVIDPRVKGQVSVVSQAPLGLSEV